MKKQHVILGIIFLGLAFALSSCVKDQSSVEGRITYYGWLTGIEYNAVDARVELDHMSYDNGIVYTNDDGYYQFTDVYDGGDYRLKASVTVNGTEYSGTSSAFTLSGDEIKTVNLVLE